MGRAKEAVGELRRLHSPYRGDGWRCYEREWYCGHCRESDGSPTDWPCESAWHLYDKAILYYPVDCRTLALGDD